ncbi:Methyltransferase-like protein 10 [Mactra antiquata]
MATSCARDDDRDFDSSELGTKEYWDSAYEKECENFEDVGDVGEIWFGEETMVKVANWIEDCDDIKLDDDIIDLGSGNGMMCIELRKRGYNKLTGVDYSDLAVTLSKSVAKSEGYEDIQFETGDLITNVQPNPCSCLNKQYKLVLDKGTYDAISLMPDDSISPRKQYLQTVKDVMTEGSLYSITSCNWTKDQLIDFFKEDFVLHSQIPFRTFQFGGQTGSTVTSLLFKLKS